MSVVDPSPGPGRAHSIPLDILDDLASRFIINAPEEEKRDMVRMCFQLELAHWFYVDEYVNNSDHNVRTCTMREFAEHMFNHVSFLKGHAKKVDEVLLEWKEYKMQVPTYGAIIMDEDLSHVLLVQGFWSKTSWGFPKGKVNEDEAPHTCAVREVYEETGFDISNLISPDIYLSTIINDQVSCLYLIPGVPRATKFQPRTKFEIKDLKWFPVADLPSHKKETMNPNYLNLTPNNLYMVLPFVRNLKKWIDSYTPASGNGSGGKQRRKRKESEKSQRKHKKSISSNTSFQDVGILQENIQNNPKIPVDSNCPQSWSNFKFCKKEVISAMTSTPGWI